MNIPRLAITSGEPSGIGPDLIIQLADTLFPAELIVIADKKMMQQRSDQLGIPVSFSDYNASLSRAENNKGVIKIIDTPCAVPVSAGILNKENASYVLDTLTIATKGCLSGEFDAMVTPPLHKGIINESGVAFTGHTEFLAELTQAELPVMMLAADDLRVALATTHLPLKDVSAAISKESLTKVISILNHDLIHKFGIENPHILICGLNPHAGEDGHLGMEEIDTIQPVIKSLKDQGMNLSGPLPADTLFTPKYLDTADAVLAMFHDQGLPVLKHVGFGHAINITLGLPIIRTSVDHGTALDLAGTGKASSGSMVAAINSAILLSNETLS
ncbi:4-hydroxythreonine-4-phosphate dehydrogenase PdxA [Cocleimonas sp. KMM 6892]|uniref:4-hydroxythreonine-4-phosphate dehydrogenase PdxA n=1 Tax=unclassified Cocleimonas TaxID=2639732 RepID=UPI002DB597BD|nr:MULTISPECIES: 4-hydroxythreonine-4-phosphate dehydrogenase PdxA [unclassified Cocleimonas]MEB8431764.1 4-hydroxythreonine-4-phosphate dehydrogenase PdxA [Cocleimonas sp. KMM 6892]MEC4715150.1 4-hydroxythreonine-4-phosphate dehydrogenase PdxA [Cocleimonas sp. KMM 6895]MEC4744036.1 4-hydroxythreonine-4-phosphate dehydrogenase PdxA [Cocleimonas sp. KMM 6896]